MSLRAGDRVRMICDCHGGRVFTIHRVHGAGRVSLENGMSLWPDQYEELPPRARPRQRVDAGPRTL
jgi:hypothetical protein